MQMLLTLLFWGSFCIWLIGVQGSSLGLWMLKKAPFPCRIIWLNVSLAVGAERWNSHVFLFLLDCGGSYLLICCYSLNTGVERWKSMYFFLPFGLWILFTDLQLQLRNCSVTVDYGLVAMEKMMMAYKIINFHQHWCDMYDWWMWIGCTYHCTLHCIPSHNLSSHDLGHEAYFSNSLNIPHRLFGLNLKKKKRKLKKENEKEKL